MVASGGAPLSSESTATDVASRTLLDVARVLHPTPAVCGAPREAAMQRLAREEAERGWYGGAIGWTSASGDGELAVALRAALLDGAGAHVWAGAGIVEGSDPEHEYDETERKMRSTREGNSAAARTTTPSIGTSFVARGEVVTAVASRYTFSIFFDPQRQIFTTSSKAVCA